MDTATREALVARFAAYLEELDRAADDGDEPDAEGPDLFTLLAELAALKSEVKLEARLVKTALDEFRALFERLRENQLRIDDERRQRHEQALVLERQGQKDFLLELLELRDRLQAGHEQALRFRPGWFGRRAAVEFVAALAAGMGMNLRRLDEILARREVQPLSALGERFDPHTMRAIELAHDASQPVGAVVSELRKGFLYQGTLLRAADVVVNRPNSALAET